MAKLRCEFVMIDKKATSSELFQALKKAMDAASKKLLVHLQEVPVQQDVDVFILTSAYVTKERALTLFNEHHN